MNNINSIIKNMTDKYKLDSLDVTTPRELVFMLLANIKDCKIADLKLSNINITNEDINKLEDLLKKVAVKKIPPQYVIGKVSIYNEVYLVNNDVLIPRQDTETLIETVINIIKDSKFNTLLDMCTGSGVVGISIANNTNINDVTLLDISDAAIDVAKQNIELNKVQNKCHTIVSNMFEKLYETNNKYDIITANPPYLTTDEMNCVSEFVKREPQNALLGGSDGLDLYRQLYLGAKDFFNNNGVIAVEIGYTQADKIINIINKYNCYTDVKVIKDINSKDRVVVCHFQKK